METTGTTDAELERQIMQWRSFLQAHPALGDGDLDELEDHLRDRIDDLRSRGLTPDEAFLIAVRRLGRVDQLSREFAREHSDRLWKQLVLGSAESTRPSRGGLLAVAFAMVAAVVIKLPALWGAPDEVTMRNAPILILGALAAYLLVRGSRGWRTWIAVAVPFAAAAVIVNAFPFAPGADTLLLTVLHLTVALWIAVGIAYVGSGWRSTSARMDFIRFTGEWVVHLALIAIGGGVLVALTLGVFSAIGVTIEGVAEDWILPCGAAGAVVVAAWLVDAKKSVIENMAPVLTKLFTPLFTLLLLTFLAAAAVQTITASADAETGLLGMASQRDVLIIFDVTLVVVLGLLLYTLSAQRSDAPASWFDTLQLVMLVAAIAVDLLVLAAMLTRIGEFGASPNKLASLGLNLILLACLAGAAWLQVGYLRGKTTHAARERWQTGFLPVYAVWAFAVAVILPPLFAFQ